MLSDNELLLHISEARELIESQISNTIWRTAIRIHELIRMRFPYAKNNEGIKDEVKFAQILAGLSSEEEVYGEPLYRLGGERYEEGHHEPVLLSDTQLVNTSKGIATSTHGVPPFQRINVRGVIVQRELMRLINAGYDFREASDIVHRLNPEIRNAYVAEFRTVGMSRGNIFYKKRSAPGNVKDEPSFPKIPEILF